MGRAYRKPKEGDDAKGAAPMRPKPWPLPKGAGQNPSTPEQSPTKPPSRRAGSRRLPAAQKQDDAAGASLPAPAPAPAPAPVATASAPASSPSSPEFEELGGRAKAADGTWIAWELVRPVRAPGRPKAPLLVLVNGLSNDGFQWRGLLPTLRKNHAVLSWDYRGHGCSENPRDVSAVSIASLADDLEAVMLDVNARRLAKTSRVTVVAYSMGCQVALEWCRAHADLVDGLALILGTPQRSMDAALLHPLLADLAAALMGAFPTLFGLLWQVIFFLAWATSVVSHPVARRLRLVNVPRADFAPFYRHLRRVHGGAYVRMLVSGQRHGAMDVLELMNRREVPSLVVQGGRDFSVDAKTNAATRRAAPRAHHVFVPDACHAGMIGKKDAIGAALEEFLDAKMEAAEFHKKRLMDVTGMTVSPPDSPPKPEEGEGTPVR